MDSFITLRSGGTLYGCYKQALRELSTRWLALIQRRANLARVRLGIESLENSDRIDRFQARLDAIDLEEKRLMLAECVRVLGDNEREFDRFRLQAEAIREMLAAEGVQFPLDAPTRDRLDRDMWEHQLKARCAVEIYTNGNITGTTMELIQCLPVSIKKRISEWLHPEQRPALIEWFVTFEPPVPALAGPECST